MLSQLVIHNFAIIDSLELDFQKAMTVITGETGAGKSIAIDALGLALGDRADASMVKHGHKRSEIIASFNISKLKEVQQFLIDQEMDNDNECILRRTISAEGGSRAYINGRPVPLQMVKTLSEKLIDIHSQHQHQSLLRENTQREILDFYGQHQTLSNEVKKNYNLLHDLSKELNNLNAAAKERASRIDFLQFQIGELETLDTQSNEWKSLDLEQKKLANIETIQHTVNDSIDLLINNDSAIISQLEYIKQQLNKLESFSPTFQPICELLDSGLININEAVNDLRIQQSDESFDNKQFEFIESRMAILLDMARKHRCEPHQLIDILEQLQSEIKPLLNAEENLSYLEEEIKTAKKRYDLSAKKLSEKREKTAKKLKNACQKLLKKLGMETSQLEISLIPLGAEKTSPLGNEKVSFQISTNPGSPSKPLNKVASGGELSRISLAIQVVTASVTQIPSLVFDEVDVGIGGGIAEVVGKLLNELGKNKQIICITHQAQVAAQGQTHWLVEKQQKAKTVRTIINSLENTEREIEIARMIGGIKLTNATQKHAKEMLKTAQSS